MILLKFRVVMIGINKDLDKYLNNRRSKEEGRFFSAPKVKLVKEEPEEVPQDLRSDEVRVVINKPGFWERMFGPKEKIVEEDLSPEEMARLEAMEQEIEKVEEAEEAHPEMTEELEEVRESLLERFFNMFRGFQHRHRLDERAEAIDYIEDEVVPKIDEDVKRVLKLVHKWLGKLPKRQKDEFKKSNDFIEYKALLEKYGVAKMSAPKGEPKEKPKVMVEGEDDYPVLKKQKK